MGSVCIATSSTWSCRGRSPRGRPRAGRSGRGRTCGNKRAGDRSDGNGCIPGFDTWLCGPDGPSEKSWPSLLTLLGGAVATLGGVLVRAVLGLGTRVRLGVLLFQFIAGGLLRLGFQARLLVFPLFLSGFFFGFALGLAGTALLRERHSQPEEQVERLEIGLRRRRDRHVETADDVDRVVVDFREDQLLFDAHRVVAAAVEAARIEPAEVTDARHRDRGEA